MQQVIQDLKDGQTMLVTVPAPQVKPGHILVRTACSLVSSGTERMLVSFGKAGWIGKAMQQPERARMVWDKIKTDGLKPTINAVFSKLDQPIPLGYSNAGTVIAVGTGVTGIKTGDRVATNGHHAEIVCVPQNLAAKVPGNVSDEAAAFTVIGAIGLQGIRLINPTFGETIVVIGLGLIGQITAQLLKANGCRVIGVDPDAHRNELAAAKGILTTTPEQARAYVSALTNGNGADGVIITAASKSNDIIAQAAHMCRRRGRIVLTGVVGLDIDRADFYEKELSFQVSCSYGPGRYDPAYEQKGQDYPIGFVRWTEQRNFEAVLQAMATGQLDVQSLISERVPLADYKKVYDHLSGTNNIATLLIYDQTQQEAAHTVRLSGKTFPAGQPIGGIIGAGNFTAAVLLPGLKKAGLSISTIASAGGLSAATLATKFDIPNVTTDYHELLNDAAINTVFITTRHHQHAAMTIAALQAGKHVFVEKPLAITQQQLDDVIAAAAASDKTISVGFNRRFAPLAVRMKQLPGSDDVPVNINITVNAGMIPAGHWTQDAETGGGRLIGEACHFIDLCSFITGSMVTGVYANAMGSTTDNASIVLQYANGSNATIHYFANGHKAYDKERVEVYSQGRTLILENWRKLTGYGFSGFSSATVQQDKGHTQQFRLLAEKLTHGGDPLISFASLVNTSRATLAIVDSIGSGERIHIDL